MNRLKKYSNCWSSNTNLVQFTEKHNKRVKKQQITSCICGFMLFIMISVLAIIGLSL